jgi:iron complex transport system substrate-binding protein
MKKTLFIITGVMLLVLMPVFAQNAALESNLTEGCVTHYDASVDYFPDKVEITDADGFNVEYFNSYKVISVTNAFSDAPLFEYVLVQCGTPAPDAADFPADTQFIEVPTGNVIAMSTTQIPHLAALGLLDKLVGLDSFDYVGNPEVRQMIDDGKLIQIGYGTEVNIEAVLDSEAEMVMTYGYDPSTDAYPVLMEAGIFTVLNSEYREASPLGRAEWIKFTGLFYNAEAQANEVYDEISSVYREAQALAASIPADERPVILWNTFASNSETWSIPGAQTYVGRLITDAGGRIALGDPEAKGNARLSFEVVYEGALDADLWITTTQGITTTADLIALDSRYTDFAPVQNGTVWSNDLSMNAVGGNNYWEVGVTNPHLLLQDLVAIFHPELMPNHEFAFFRPIAAK